MSATLLAKIHSIRAARIAVVKERKNQGLRSDYANLADVMAAIGPVLDAAGLSVACEPGALRIVNDALWIQTMHLIVSDGTDLTFRDFDVCFPAAIISRSTGGAAVNEPQRQGMAHTYGRRYAIVAYFNVIVGDDDDAQRLGVERERAASATVSDAAPWTAFLAGGWRDAPAGDGRTLNDLNNAQRKALWEKDPASKPLMAWVGDLVSDMLQDAGYSWEKFIKWADAGLPEVMEHCTPGLLKIAATKAKEIPDQ